MGQEEIIKVLTIERKCKNNDYLTPKEIQKAMGNIGFIVRIENVNKGIRKIRKTNILEVKDKEEYRKSYRVKASYLEKDYLGLNNE